MEFDWIESGPTELISQHAERIEKALGYFPNVRTDPNCPADGSVQIDKNCRAEIVIKNATCPQVIALHEMLHVIRFWVDEIPMLGIKNGDPRKATINAIDNMYEHSIIIPHQRSLGDDGVVPRFEGRILLRITELDAKVVADSRMRPDRRMPLFFALDASWMGKDVADKLRAACEKYKLHLIFDQILALRNRCGGNDAQSKINFMTAILPHFGFQYYEVKAMNMREGNAYPLNAYPKTQGSLHRAPNQSACK